MIFLSNLTVRSFCAILLYDLSAQSYCTIFPGNLTVQFYSIILPYDFPGRILLHDLPDQYDSSVGFLRYAGAHFDQVISGRQADLAVVDRIRLHPVEK